MDKVFPLNILERDTRLNEYLHNMILFWIPITIVICPFMSMPSIIAVSCNVGVISPTRRWNV